MTKNPSLEAILRKIERPANRSTLFHWMVEHHDEVTAATNGARLVWADLCASFMEMGLTCLTGEPATPAVARTTWYRARKLVAQRQAAAQRRALTGLSPRSLMPSASPRDRVPIERTPVPLPATEPARNADGTVIPRYGVGPITAEEVKAKKARFWRQLEIRSGRE